MMKAKTVIHLHPEGVIRTPETMPQVIFRLDRLPKGEMFALRSLTGNGKIRGAYIAPAAILRLEAL